MIVENGAEWNSGTGRQSHKEALNENDGRRLKGAEVWDAMSWPEQHAFLDVTADILVLAHLRKKDAISQEFFEQRVRELKGQ